MERARCEHLIVSRCGKVCEATAKFRATMPTGKIMNVCGRHTLAAVPSRATLERIP